MKPVMGILVLLMGCHAAAFDQWNLETQEVLRWRGQYYDLTTSGERLYLACKRGVEIYSLSDPADPQLLGSFFTDGLANGVAVNDPYLYVGDVYGFSVWDVSDPSGAIRLGGFKRAYQEGYQERLLYRDGYVFVAAYNSGLQIIDVSDPARPFIAVEADTPAYAWDLALYGDAVFVMDFFSMEIIDISRIMAPLNRTSFDAMFAGGIAISGDIAYLAYIDGIRVLDISDPFDPVIIAEPGPTGGGAAESVSVSGDLAFLAHSSYVEIYDISIPAAPLQIGFFYPPGHPRKVHAYGHYLYTILDDNGFHIADVSNPVSPVTVRHVDPSVWGSRQDVMVSGDYLYLSDWNRGLVIYDISDDSKIEEISSHSTPGVLNEVAVEGNRAYLSCYSELRVLDISTPAAPEYLGSYTTTGNTWSVTIKGNRAYYCDLYSFQILDISDPASIRRLGVLFLAQDGVPLRCAVKGTTAFLAHGYGGLKIIDISDEEHPQVRATYPRDRSRSYSFIHLNGSVLMVMDSSSGLDILDVSSPMVPALIRNLSFGDLTASGFTVKDSQMFVSLGPSGVQGYDMSDLLNPQLNSRADTPGDALGVSADSSRLYVADDYDLYVFRIGGLNPDAYPPEISIEPPDQSDLRSQKSAVVRGEAFDQESGVHFIEISTDGGQSWLQAKGQETWAFPLCGIEPSVINLSARAVDWSGLRSEPDSIEIDWQPAVPSILLAGFETSHATSSDGGFTVSALVSDPFEHAYLQTVKLQNSDGTLTDTFLSFQAESSGIVYYSLDTRQDASSPGQYLYKITARDTFSNRSATWPYLHVRD